MRAWTSGCLLSAIKPESAPDPKRTSVELASVQIEREVACVTAPVKVEEAEGPMCVVRPDILGEPNHFAHIRSQVGEVIDCVACHPRLAKRRGRVRNRVEPVVGKAAGDFPVECGPVVGWCFQVAV